MENRMEDSKEETARSASAAATDERAGGAHPTEESGVGDLERDAYGRDVLGFIANRCPHCDACLYVSEEKAQRGELSGICLNGCMLRGYEYRKLLHMPRAPAG